MIAIFFGIFTDKRRTGLFRSSYQPILYHLPKYSILVIQMRCSSDDIDIIPGYQKLVSGVFEIIHRHF